MVAAWRRTAVVDHPRAERALVGGLKPTSGARDVAAVVHSRLQTLQKQLPTAAATGYVPGTVSTDREDLHELLNDVQQRITERISAIPVHTLANEPDWVRQLRSQSGLQANDDRWKDLVRDVAGYRDRWDIDNPSMPLGPPPNATDWQQAMQRTRIEARIVAARSGTPTANPSEPSLFVPTATPHSPLPTVGPSL